MAMAEVTTSPAIPAVGEAAAPAIDPTSSTIPSKRPRAPLRDIYALPTPIRTFPLPSFYPSNPISLFHVVYAWLSHALSPPPPEPSVIHTGVWSPGTRSVHVADERSIRALWEQGFYGKGNLSRSEPNWLRREQIRRGLVEGDVSEEITVGRRNERITAKWERARAEQEAIERTRLAESRAGHNGTADALPNRVSAVPVGPLELLALPNSYRDIASSTTVDGGGGTDISAGRLLSDDDAAPAPDGRAVGFENSTTVDGSQGDAAAARHTTDSQEGLDNGTAHPHTNGESFTRDDSRDSLMDGNAPHASGPPPPDWDGTVAKDGDPPLKRQKSVRFSPQVQSTTFLHSDPPSPNHSTPPSVRGFEPSAVVGVLSQNSRAAALGSAESGETWLPPPVRDIANKEHLQLSPEEAFFLVFALGALRVVDPATGAPIPAEKLLALFRAHSYFPPRVSLPELQPDDSFLVHYAVYHHFRSLGWVPRHGIKFGVDWLLYLRGPVFDHAEFGLVVLPSYSDPWWKDHGRKAPRRSWAWLHGVNRVLSHAVKSLVLVYVDVPSPAAFAEAMELVGSGGGIAAALKRYKIREVMIRRWSSNRNRS